MTTRKNVYVRFTALASSIVVSYRRTALYDPAARFPDNFEPISRTWYRMRGMRSWP